MSLIFDIECDAIDAITLTHYTYLLGMSDATFSYIFHYSISVCSSPSPPSPPSPASAGIWQQISGLFLHCIREWCGMYDELK
jgi:hypothetical protein